MNGVALKKHRLGVTVDQFSVVSIHRLAREVHRVGGKFTKIYVNCVRQLFLHFKNSYALLPVSVM